MRQILKMKIRNFAPLLLLCMIAQFAGAENIRGKVAGTAVPTGEPVSFKPEELVVLQTEPVSRFQGGLELRMQIPPSLRRYQNSFALLIYRDVDPVPTTENRSYSGTRTYMRLLPGREGMYVRIPFAANHQITGDALTDVLPVPVDPGDFPLIVTVLPVMKGIPDSAFREILTIGTTPIWKNEGSLSLNITNPSDDPEELITAYIDGREVEIGEVLNVEAGLHRVRIDSSQAQTVEKTVAVEPGEQLIVDLKLDYRLPELTVNIPEGAVVLLDGEPLSGPGPITAVDIRPGEHTVTYRLGELDVSRAFTVGPGAKISIDLVIEIDIFDLQEGTGNQYGAGDG
jgi:hypothetical protein